MDKLRKKGGYVCAYKNCVSATNRNKYISFFRFPKASERCMLWISLSGREDLMNKSADELYKNYRLCGLHFKTTFFANDLKNRLVYNALPYMFTVQEPSTSCTSTSTTEPNTTLLIGNTFPVEHTKDILSEGETQDAVIREEQFNLICRTCLSSKDTFNLFQTKCEEIGLDEIINTYMAIQVQENDRLPQNICSACICSMVKMYVFIKQCERSDASLQAFLNNNGEVEMCRKQNIEKNCFEYDLIKIPEDSDPLADIPHPSSEDLNYIKEEVEELTAESQSAMVQLVEQHLLFAPVSAETKLPDGDVIIISDDTDSLTGVEHTGKRIQNNEVEELTMESESTIIKDDLIPDNTNPFTNVMQSDENKDLTGELQSIYTRDAFDSMGTLLLHKKQNNSRPSNCKNSAPLSLHNSDVSILEYLLKSDKNNENTKNEAANLIGSPSSVIWKKNHLQNNKRTIKLATMRCRTCEKSFTNRERYLKHMAVHKEQLRKCNEILSETNLDKNFAFDYTNLREYLLKLKKCCINIYPCTHCDKFFVKHLQFKEHQKSIKLLAKVLNNPSLLLNGKTNSELCLEGKENERTANMVENANLPTSTEIAQDNDFFNCLKRLKESNQFPVTLYWCKACIQFFDYREQYLLHKKHIKHLRPLKYPCLICNKLFRRREFLKNHMRTHTKEKPYVCNICGTKFGFTVTLKRHMMVHTGEKPYVCEICGKGFRQLGTLQQHQTVHTAKCAYLCSYCGIQCKQYSTYANHLKQYHTVAALDTISQEAFMARKRLKTHTNPRKEKTLVCQYCGKFFISAAALRCHVRIHTGDRPYKCAICNATHAQKTGLNSHMRKHTGEKPYQCRICLKPFAQITHRAYHMVSVHTKQKAFKCSYCGRCFALKGNLTQHTRIHTGETPFACNVCGKRFYHSNNMKKHRRTHEKVNANTEGVTSELEA